MIKTDIKRAIMRGTTGDVDIKLTNIVKIPNNTLK
jgi:hypothetical protein